ncbi:hypothetical protein BH20CHL6_BH20CHL6_02010 [soil metagenome]
MARTGVQTGQRGASDSKLSIRGALIGFLVGFAGWLGAALVAPIENSLLATAVAYLGPVALGAVAALLGTGGLSGLAGLLAGMLVAYGVAYATGLYGLPSPGEAGVTAVLIVLFLGFASVGYLAGLWTRRALMRKDSTASETSRTE